MNNSSPQKVIILVLGLVLFFRCILPYFCNSVIVNEQFAETESEETEGEGPVVKDNAIMDGREFQNGTMETPSAPDGPSGVDSIPENYYFLDDGDNGRMSIQHNLCSRSCCSDQYPTPFKMKYDPYVCKNKDKFIPSRIMCNNAFQDSGCLCLTKEQGEFLYNRGGNGREWF